MGSDGEEDGQCWLICFSSDCCSSAGFALSDKSKRRRRKDAKGRPDPKKRLATAFSNNQAGSAAPKPRPVRPPPQEAVNPYKKVVDHAKEDDFMSSLLGDLQSSGPSSFMSAPQSRKRKSSPDYDSGPYRSSRQPTSSEPSSDDLLSRVQSDPSSDGIGSDSAANTDYKKPRLGVENQLDDLGFGDTTYDFNDFEAGADAGGADFDNMDVDIDEPSAAQPKVKEEFDEDDLDIKHSVGPASSSKPAPSAPRARTLVNARSTRPSAVKPSPLAAKSEDNSQEEEGKPQSTRKPKGMDWRLAAANVALAEPSSDDLPSADDVASSAAKHGDKQAKNGSAAAPTTKIDAFEPDGSLRFYWIDHVDMGGVVHLTGKVYDKAATDPNKKWVSCCLAVNGIQRNLFVLPRGPKSAEKKAAATQQKSQSKKQKKSQKEKSALDSDEEQESSEEGSDSSEGGSDDESNDEDPEESEFIPTVDDVEDDFREVMDEANIKRWSCKEVERNYAFELPGVPSESKYLKVVYGFDGESSLSHLLHQREADSQLCRASTAHGSLWPYLQSRLWHQHFSF